MQSSGEKSMKNETVDYHFSSGLYFALCERRNHGINVKKDRANAMACEAMSCYTKICTCHTNAG